MKSLGTLYSYQCMYEERRWCQCGDSIWGPLALGADALPTELTVLSRTSYYEAGPVPPLQCRMCNPSMNDPFSQIYYTLKTPLLFGKR